MAQYALQGTFIMQILPLLALSIEYAALKREIDHKWRVLGREKVPVLLLWETPPSQLCNRYAK